MGAIATAVYGALGTGPRGEVAEITHTWEDVEARLGRLILTAAAALDDLTGDAWDTDEIFGKGRMHEAGPPAPRIHTGRVRGPVARLC
ncbi:hypothetical protein ABZ690_17285 [Streptomyces sp. NPDC006967]|uniref:hypothetical protein n=1 Tax=unclassified Streptomyces TaxID=2593676 RepID=UPI000CD580C7|nr:hypothetical protein [Streptomyces sp. SM1]